MIYLLTTIGLTPGGYVQYTFTKIQYIEQHNEKRMYRTYIKISIHINNNITSSVYDCTVEDVEYIYNKLSLIVTLILHLVVVITLP